MVATHAPQPPCNRLGRHRTEAGARKGLRCRGPNAAACSFLSPHLIQRRKSMVNLPTVTRNALLAEKSSTRSRQRKETRMMAATRRMPLANSSTVAVGAAAAVVRAARYEAAFLQNNASTIINKAHLQNSARSKFIPTLFCCWIQSRTEFLGNSRGSKRSRQC